MAFSIVPGQTPKSTIARKPDLNQDGHHPGVSGVHPLYNDHPVAPQFLLLLRDWTPTPKLAILRSAQT